MAWHKSITRVGPFEVVPNPDMLSHHRHMHVPIPTHARPITDTPLKARGGGSIRIPMLTKILKIFFALKYSWYIHILGTKSENYQIYHFGPKLRLQKWPSAPFFGHFRPFFATLGLNLFLLNTNIVQFQFILSNN